MIETKIFEIRDSSYLPHGDAPTRVLATRLEIDDPTTEEASLLRNAGFAAQDLLAGTYVLLVTLSTGIGYAHSVPYNWGGGTLPAAHRHIVDHWAALKSGQLIDIGADHVSGAAKLPQVARV